MADVVDRRVVPAEERVEAQRPVGGDESLAVVGRRRWTERRRRGGDGAPGGDHDDPGGDGDLDGTAPPWGQ